MHYTQDNTPEPVDGIPPTPAASTGLDIKKLRKRKLKGRVGSTGWEGLGKEKASERLCKSAWMTAACTMTACTPINEHGQAVRAGDSQGAEGGLVYWEACQCRKHKTGQISRGRSIKLEDTPVVKTTRTKGPWRI